METTKFATRNARGAWVSIGILLALGMAASIRSVTYDAAPLPAAVPESPQAIVDRHLAWADSQGQGDLAARVMPIRQLFDTARKGSRGFAEDALSLKSKWTMMTDFVSGRDDHAGFLRERFRIRVFAPEELESVVESAVAGHVRRLEDVDSELLVRLQADLADVPSLQLSANADRQAILASFESAIHQAVSHVQAELGPNAGFELASYFAGEVLAAATFRLVASSGILAAGTASAPVSLGVGIVVGLVVDMVLSWIYDEIFDPVGELSKKINETLDALEQLILTGDSDGAGLIQRLQDYGTKRSAARNSVIRSLVLPGSASASPVIAF